MMTASTMNTTPAPAAPAAAALRIAAMDAHGVHLPDGTSLVRRSTGPAPSLELLATAARNQGIGQLWLLPDWTADPTAADLWRDTGFGWRLDPRTPAHWTRAYFPRGSYGWVDLASVALDPKRVWTGAPGEEMDGRTLVDALTLYARALGITYHHSPGATGTQLLRDLHNSSGRGGHSIPIDLPAPLPAPAREQAIECPIHVMRPLSPDERRAKYLHSYDKNGAWLAACSSLALGYGAPEHVIPPNMTSDDLKLPGYFRMHLSDKWHPLSYLPHPLPPVLPKPRRGSSLVWVTQPTLALLREAGADYGVTEAWVWTRHHQPLTPWYKRLRDARAALMADDSPAARLALAAVKATYTHTLGRLGTPGKDGGLVGTDLYRPDWMQHNRALANANMHRQLWKLAAEGVFPFAVGGQDTLYIVSDEADPYQAAPASLKLGAGLGQWKPKDEAVPLADVLAQMERGKHGDEWRGGLSRLQSWLKHRNDGEGE